MTIKVLITRRFKQGSEVDMMVVLNQLRSKAMTQSGYISGESLLGHDDPSKLVVISTWDSLEDWTRWKENPARWDIESQLEPILLRPSEYEVFFQGPRPTS